jgi:hypothetical protein
MTHYFVNRNAHRDSGHREMQIETCPWIPDPDDRSYLDFDAFRRAVQEATMHFAQANGCFYCSPRWHSV